MNRADLVRERSDLTAKVKDLTSEIEGARERITNIGIALQVPVGLDEAKLSTAAHLLRVQGKPITPTRSSVLRDAMEAIAIGGGRLAHEYFAVKNYDRFGDQREDHRYGWGPKHGHIVFSVRLEERARLPLTAEQIEACLYTLQAIAQEKLTGDQLNVIRRETRTTTEVQPR